MKRHPRYRPRREFARLEAKLEPDFEEKAWRQFIDSILYNKKSENRSFQDQFRLQNRIRRAHARRNRYNDKRRAKRYQYVRRHMRPEYAAYVAAGLVSVWKVGEELARPDLRGALFGVDRRLSMKLIKELEAVHLMMNPPAKPWTVTRENVWVEEEEAIQEPEDRGDFLATLEPTPVPDLSDMIPFEEEEAGEPLHVEDEPPVRHTETFAAAS